MNNKKLHELYRNIQASPKQGLFFILKLKSNLFLTKSKSGSLALGFTFDQPQPKIGDSVFEGIGIQYFQNGEVVYNRKRKECSFLIIENLEEENSARFYDLVKDVLEETEYDKYKFLNISEIIMYFISWAALFKKLILSQDKDIVGLFGELYFILKSGHPKTLIKRWQAPLNSKHDFAYGKNFLDVNTSRTGLEHHFELEQVSPCKENNKYIASICVKESKIKGKSVSQLIEKLSRTVSKKELHHLLKKRARNIETRKKKYEVTSLCIFDAKDIPQPIQTSNLLSDINFVSRLSTIKNKLSFKATIARLL